MVRSQEPELMDDAEFARSRRTAFHAELSRLSRILGNDKDVIERLRCKPPKRVIDIGCGNGALLAAVRKALGTEVLGVDLHPDASDAYDVEIVEADASASDLPASDAALCVLTVHHLNDEQVVALVRNVGRSSQRFLIIDLVRHPVPLLLFRIFMKPFLSRLVFVDGVQSVRRAYTTEELRALVVRGLAGTNAVFEHWVSALHSKQIIDIDFKH